MSTARARSVFSDSYGRTEHVSRKKSYSKSTATSSMADHLFTASGSGNGPSKQKSFEETTVVEKT